MDTRLYFSQQAFRLLVDYFRIHMCKSHLLVLAKTQQRLRIDIFKWEGEKPHPSSPATPRDPCSTERIIVAPNLVAVGYPEHG